ncbi:MAG TPA: tetratricopeptide repeat protein [Bryobacteraceae bacterium]|nr:tetratricopeptide repeat protein [Bryobacteraceae bacterium]
MRRCALRPAAALLWFLSSAAASDAPRWLKISSPNFELYTTAGERGGRDVAQYLERVRGFFLEAMGLGLKSGPPVCIVVFRSDKEYAPYAPNEVASAFYLGTDDRDYIIMKSASGEHYPRLVHEYTHLLVKHSGVAVPVWFNEGLAEFYSNLKPLAGKIQVGDIIMPHYMLLRQSKWIDLRDLLAAEHGSPLYNAKSHAGLFYAESWALVHMLYLGKDYRPKLTELLAGIKAGASMPDTFRKAYGKSVEEVQSDLRAYMGGERFNASLFDTKMAAAAGRPDTADSTPLETGLVLAEILVHLPGKASDAREMYNRLARDNPKDWRIEQGLARLSWRENKAGEAMEHYARASALGSTDARMYLDYGRLLRLRQKDAEAVAELKRATELDPDYQEARVELGLAYVVNQQYADALTEFQRVKRLPPEQAFGYFHAMAYAYYRLESQNRR